MKPPPSWINRLTGCDDGFILPVFPAGVGGVGVADVEHHIKLPQEAGILPDVVEADETHVEGGAG